MFVVVLVGALGAWLSFQPEVSPVPPTYTSQNRTNDGTDVAPLSVENAPKVEVIAQGLTIPWEVLFLPDGELLVTQRDGSVVLLKKGVVIPIAGVKHTGEGGLLGAALHPEFRDNNFVYLFQTTQTEFGLINRIDRYTLKEETLLFDRTIVDALPGAMYHDGGRIMFGPDGHLYVTLGDAGDERASQDTQNLAGSILRYTAEGEIPQDNPFGNAVHSYGHRNPQGLAWDGEGALWSTEHGRSGVTSGFDELNYISKGANYGWPDFEGDEEGEGITPPVRHSGDDTTWAPGGLAYLDGYLYIPGLRGETLYRVKLDGTRIVAWDEFFVGEYGRLRTVTVGPDNLLYLTTSNRDGRGRINENDDRIIRINPRLLE